MSTNTEEIQKDLPEAFEVQKRVELICDLSRRIELLDALMVAAREKRRLSREILSDQLNGTEILSAL